MIYHSQKYPYSLQYFPLLFKSLREIKVRAFYKTYDDDFIRVVRVS